MPVKLLTSGGGGVNLVPSSSIASDQTMYLPTSGTSGGTVLCTDSTGGTANGVLYLNGSKQVTSGSALTFDGSKLTVATSDLTTAFFTNATTSGATTGAGIGFNVYNGSSVAQNGSIVSTASTWSYGTYSANQLSISANGSGGVRVASANAPIVFHTGDSSNAGLSTERMRLDSSGNLGIGTSSPAGKLHVVGNTYAEGDIYFNTSTGKLSSGSGGWPLIFGINGGEKARIDSSGNLGIGTSSPGTKLTVVGTNTVGEFSSAGQGGYSCQVDVRADNAAGSNAALYLECPGIIGGGMYLLRDARQLRVWCGSGASGVSLTDGATSWGTFSDERLKDIIEPITDAASKVSKLRSVIGKFKTDEEGKRRAFLIAQDVKAVLPEAVYQNSEADDTLSLAYTDVIPLLVAAIKEQQALIESLTQRIEALEYTKQGE